MSVKAIQRECADVQIPPQGRKPPVSVPSMAASQRACAQGEQTKFQTQQTHVVSVASMEAPHGLCASMQVAPRKHKRAVSVASMEAIHGLCASMQVASRKQSRAVSVASMEATACASIQVAQPVRARKVSVASMEAVHGRGANIQGAPP